MSDFGLAGAIVSGASTRRGTATPGDGAKTGASHPAIAKSAGSQAADVGGLTPPLWGFEEYDKLMVFYEHASGARMHANFFRIGGARQELPPKLVDDIWAFCDPLLKVWDLDREPHLQAAQTSFSTTGPAAPIQSRRPAQT